MIEYFKFPKLGSPSSCLDDYAHTVTKIRIEKNVFEQTNKDIWSIKYSQAWNRLHRKRNSNYSNQQTIENDEETNQLVG